MFFGWYVVAGTFVAQLLVAGFLVYSVTLFVPLVRAEFAVSMAQVMQSLTVGTFAGMLLMPAAGVMFDRWPMRWVMSGGVLLFAAGLWAIAQSQSITSYVLFFAITMAIGNTLVGSPACQTVLARWFSKSRGRAMGISAIGTSLGGIAIPALVVVLLERFGWRSALEIIAALALLVVLPVVVATVRGRPSDIGLEAEAAGAAGGDAAPEQGLTMAQIVRHPCYWFIGVPLGLLFSAYTVGLVNIAPYAASLDIPPSGASGLIMAIAVMGFIGKLGFGVIADRVNLKWALWAVMALALVGFLLLAAQPSYPIMLGATALMGLAAGGMVPVWGSMMAAAFGLLSYGRAMGLMGPLLTLLVLPSFTVVGTLFDISGSYQLPLLIFSGVIALAMLLLLPLRLPR